MPKRQPNFPQFLQVHDTDNQSQMSMVSSLSLNGKKMKESKGGQLNQPSSLSKTTIAPKIDDIISHCIESIWDRYDVDNSGQLDREECLKFIMESIKGYEYEMQDDSESSDEDEDQLFTKKQFDKFYDQVDIDGNGFISKQEMI